VIRWSTPISCKKFHIPQRVSQGRRCTEGDRVECTHCNEDGQTDYLVVVLWAVKFWQQYCWTITGSGMWFGVTGCVLHCVCVCKDYSDSIFGVKDSNKVSMVTTQPVLLTLWTVWNHMPENTISHPRRTESSILVFFTGFSTCPLIQLPFWLCSRNESLNTLLTITCIFNKRSAVQYQTHNDHLSSHPVCNSVYIHTKKFSSSPCNSGLHNWFLLLETHPEGHSPLLQEAQGVQKARQPGFPIEAHTEPRHNNLCHYLYYAWYYTDKYRLLNFSTAYFYHILSFLTLF
jgi:hypothetical protein